MKKGFALFLQVIIVLIGTGALAFMLLEPQIEGRNIGATQFQIYFNDAFLVYAYLASIPFFVALYQAFTLFGSMSNRRSTSQKTMRALRTIRFCALSLIGFALIPEAYLMIVRPGDDIAGGVFMGLLVIIGSSIVAIATSVFEKNYNKQATN